MTTDLRPAASGAPAARPRSGFAHDLVSVAIRALRQIPREPEAVLPALAIPVFFFVVNIGALQDVAERNGISDYKAFQLPVAIIFSVTGVSRAGALVTDIVGGYFDRLLLTPMKRLPLLLGLMVADFVLFLALSVCVLALGFLVGVRFAAGPGGVLAFLLVSALWGLAFTGFPYAVALKTGNPAALTSSFILFFPIAFFTTAFLPQEALTGWFATVADFNPVTYVLAALRSLIIDGWQATPLLQGLAAIAVVLAINFSFALAALRGRVSRA
jgi:ABC-2 type transport system permease protein